MMSSENIEVSSNENFSSKAKPSLLNPNKSLLHPNFANPQREIKNRAKSTCGLQKKSESDVEQVLFYKEKAHQSFMQVIQVQELHEEEISQLKDQYERKVQFLQSELRQKTQIIEVFEKNHKNHNLKLQNTFEINEIQIIECRQNNETPFDESTILNFRELLSDKEIDAKIESLRDSLLNAIMLQLNKYLPNNTNLAKKIKTEVSTVFNSLKDIQLELKLKLENHEALLQKYEEVDANYKKLKSKFQSMQKDATLMSQNLRRIKEQKANLQKIHNQLERKNYELEKSFRFQQNNKELLVNSLSRDNIASFSSRNLQANHKHIVKNVPGRLKTLTSNQEINKSENHGKLLQSELIESSQLKNSSQNSDSFNVKDLMAELKKEEKVQIQVLQKNEKRPHLIVSPPIDSKIRRKSFGK